MHFVDEGYGWHWICKYNARCCQPRTSAVLPGHSPVEHQEDAAEGAECIAWLRDMMRLLINTSR